MNDERYDRLREAGWRRALTSAEQDELRAWLEAHPQARGDWQAEAGLNTALRKLPNVPVPSNFTARVLQEIEREAVSDRRRRGGSWPGFNLRHWLPRIAVVALLVGVSLSSVHFYRIASRQEIVSSVAAFSEVPLAPPTDALADFDSIRLLSSTPTADTELLSLLQ